MPLLAIAPLHLCLYFNDPPTTEIYTLSLHDALPILIDLKLPPSMQRKPFPIHSTSYAQPDEARQDRKSTRLNSSHTVISYAVFCLKKKKRHRLRPEAVRVIPERVQCTGAARPLRRGW